MRLPDLPSFTLARLHARAPARQPDRPADEYEYEWMRDAHRPPPIHSCLFTGVSSHPIHSCHLEVVEDTNVDGHTLDLALAAAAAYGAALSRAIRVYLPTLPAHLPTFLTSNMYMYMSTGAALSRAIRVDPRRRGAVASSKGTLSK